MIGKYPVINLCESTRFKERFLEAQKRLSIEGDIFIRAGLFGTVFIPASTWLLTSPPIGRNGLPASKSAWKHTHGRRFEYHIKAHHHVCV